MENQRKTLLVLLLIVLREAGPTAACSSRCRPNCRCHEKGLRSVPQYLPATITKLKLGSNYITSLRPSDFSKYTKLRELEFQQNQISIVNEQTFSNLAQLKMLHLHINKLTYIQPGTFSGLSHLRDIKLGENQITSIEPGTFSNLPGLVTLTLCCNKLTEILPGTFSNLPKLANLRINKNKIIDIKSGTFADLPQLSHLGLDRNQIRCIQPGAFSNLPKLGLLDLRQNRLTSIHPDIISIFLPKDRMFLILHENPWNCDCRVAALYEYNRKFIPKYQHEKIVCQEPSNLRMKILDDILPEDLICEEPPKIVSFDKKIGGTLVQGEILHLVCEASGIPTPDITVTLPSTLIATAESSGRVTVEVNGTITIRDVTAADAGQYICTATNPSGSASDKLSVEVETLTSVMPGVSTSLVEISDVIAVTSVMTSTSVAQSGGMMSQKPTLSNKLFVEVETPTSAMSTSAAQSDGMMFQKPAIVRFQISDNTLAQGEALHLACEASGIPAPNILVTLPSRLNATVESGGRVTVGVNGTITITNVTASDAGQYMCIASNIAGSASASVFVDVQTATSDSPPFNGSSLVPASQSENNPMSFLLEFAVGFGTFSGVLLLSGLVLTLQWKRRKKNAPVVSAATNNPPDTDNMVNSYNDASGGQGRSSNPDITSSAAGTNEQADIENAVYEDPESLVAIAGPSRAAVCSKERPVVCAPKAKLAHQQVTVHELVNIVYEKCEAGYDDDVDDDDVDDDDVDDHDHDHDHHHEARKHSSIPPEEEGAADTSSHFIDENDDEQTHDTAHDIYENTGTGDEAVLYASAQAIYGNGDENAVSAASHSIYRTKTPETLASQVIYGNDDRKPESVAPQFIYEN